MCKSIYPLIIGPQALNDDVALLSDVDGSCAADEPCHVIMKTLRALVSHPNLIIHLNQISHPNLVLNNLAFLNKQHQ